MRRATLVALVLISTGMPAFAGIICPPGLFVIRLTDPASRPELDGVELALGHGRAALTDVCAGVRAGSFHPAGWLLRIRVRWRRCEGPRLALRARWSFDAPLCTRLEGILRTAGGRRTPFVAERVIECGNGLRERGEECDGQSGTLFGTPCCTPDCRVKPDCPRLCDRDFACRDGEICEHTCGFGGQCKASGTVECDTGPVCACDEHTPYPDRCAAYAAGTGVSRLGPCPTP